MNDKIRDFARAEILFGLSQLPEANVTMFKKMYSHGNIELPIEQVVNKIPDDKLDWAMQQVENTLKKKESKDVV
jgi:hypothetical protein